MDHAGDAHDPLLAHHFETRQQQFDAAKLGMWLFLATEFLLFGGLFCAYAVLRSRQPELFDYGSRFLDTRLGATNTVVLIMSSFTMAMAVRCAQLGRRFWLVSCLSLTVLGGAVFMGIKYIEYAHKFHENLVWGLKLYEEPHGEAPPGTHGFGTALVSHAVASADATRGRALWNDTCRKCHGMRGEGIPGQGKSMRGSTFIAGRSDVELIAFIKEGRSPTDPLNTTGLQMPSMGGNPLLSDQDLADIVAYLRTFPGTSDTGAPAQATAQQQATSDTETDSQSEPTSSPAQPEKSVVPLAGEPPSGLVREFFPGAAPPAIRLEDIDLRHDPNRPANLHLFFAVYFLMTGLHGIHVLVGMILITTLAVRAAFGAFGPRHFTPVDLVGLYWHVVDIIWIFLFPLLYLI